MQLTALRYFLETARLGSIRRAAEVLYVAPSAISRQIALLEQQYGMALLERHAGGVSLTTAGEVFARHARTTMRDFDRLQAEIDDLQNLRRGTVRIFTVEATVAGLLYNTIDAFASKHPGISYDVQVVGGLRAIAALAAEECDIAVSFQPEPHRDVEEVQVLRDPIVAVMHPSHPLASRARLNVRDLDGQVVALLDDTHATRRLIDAALTAHGVIPSTILTVNQIGLAVAFVQSGRAMTFAPRHVVGRDVEAGFLKTAIIEEPSLLATRFVLCRHKSRPPTLPAQAFLAALCERFAALDKEVNRKRRR